MATLGVPSGFMRSDEASNGTSSIRDQVLPRIITALATEFLARNLLVDSVKDALLRSVGRVGLPSF